MGDALYKAKQVVLVVEDEPLLRMIAVETIEDAGFEVIQASDATEAVCILEARLDIRIMFTDIDMPRGIDGMRLAALVRDRWPPIAIIVTSGHYLPGTVKLPPGGMFFAKPYRGNEVVAAIRQMAA